jgi:hypothetical protein
MYLSRAEKFDKDRTKSWKADGDGILIYVRPAFLSMSCALQLKLDQTVLVLCSRSRLCDRRPEESAARP